MCEFYAYRLMQRIPAGSDQTELPHSCGRLFQQYVVDAYAKVESTRLTWVMKNQQKLRMESLLGLLDHLYGPSNCLGSTDSGRTCVQHLPKCSSPSSDGYVPPNRLHKPPLSASAIASRCDSGSVATDSNSKNVANISTHTRIGTPVILPATFGGSPRALHQLYLDAMALVARYGRPDFFLTLTANPNWKEIRANLRPGETAANRPDLVARVFHTKFKLLLKRITQEHILGKAVAWTWVIEFQKRGLPHAHLLLIVASSDKLDTPAKINRVVVAEIPDPEYQAFLYELVNRHMVHGPCGPLNPDCPCMQDGVCTKHFPKPWREETVVNLNGFPAYRRREQHPLRTVAKGLLDCRSIVPYSPILLELWDGHLNVEVCTSIKAVKYLYKYTYKGPDRACLEYVVDEVSDFLDARYVGAPEAVWRIFEYSLQGRSHAVERLPVHLPLHQRVLFQHGVRVLNYGAA